MTDADDGLLVRFDSATTLVQGAEALRAAGFQPLDAYAPFPVPGLARALGYGGGRIPLLALISGLLASIAAFGLQWYAAFDYPFVVGGKPLFSWPAFLPVSFEVGVLAAVLSAFIAMLAGNRLPQPYHPVFNGPGFERASGDGFFLLMDDEGDALRQLLDRLDARDVTAVTS